jgi:hypothetical protein
MTQLSRRSTMGVLAFALVVTALQSSPSATHSWNGYHWARSSTEVTIALGDNVSTAWDGNLAAAWDDWNQSSVLDLYVDAGQAKGRNCRPPTGRIEVCNSSYGNNGWVGIAQIWVNRDDHITAGSARMNDYYFSQPPYNTDPAWRQFVMCQELGHTFGLGHQDENFYNGDIEPSTCMDYSIDPSNNQHPNQHDYEQLEDIYAHDDSGPTSPASQAGSGVDLNSPSEWGRLMKSSRGGRLQVFERDFGNGQRIVTFVIWA